MTPTAPLVRLAAATAGLLLAGSASATVITSTLTPEISVAVATRVGNQMADDQLSTGGSLLYGVSRASPLGANALVQEGVPWSHPCAVTHCDSITSQFANAKGEINAELGRFKALTSLGLASADGAGQTILSQTDVVTFGPSALIKPPQLKMHLDLDSHAGNSVETRGYSLFDFTVSLSLKACNTDLNPDGCERQVFYFHAQDYYGTGPLDSWYATGLGAAPLADGGLVPVGGLDLVIDLFDYVDNVAQIGAEYDLAISSRSYSECSARSDSQPEEWCSTYLDASHTAYVGITGLASSTYAYPGMAAAGPGTPVPEPASLPMVLAAFGLAIGAAGRPLRHGR